MHVATIGDSRHRLGIEMTFFALTGCDMRPFAARRLAVAFGIASVLAVLGFFAPEAGPSRLFR